MSLILNNFFSFSMPKRLCSPLKAPLIALPIVGLMGCSSGNDSDATGFVKLYNGSQNAPGLYLTLDEKLDEDEEDEIEITYSAIEYGQAGSNKEVKTGTYYYELAWQDEDSNERSDLERIAQEQITVKEDAIQFIVVDESIATPNIRMYDIEVVDDEDDAHNDLFNIRILNLHTDSPDIDLYMSKSDETFNEANLMGAYSYSQLSDNQKLAQDQYIFYITQSGTQDVLFQSTEIDYAYTAQYVMVVRENLGHSDSPYILDRVSSSSSEEFLDFDAEGRFRIYNAIQPHDQIDAYNGHIDIAIDSLNSSATINDLALGQFSEEIVQPNGDYSLDVTVSLDVTMSNVGQEEGSTEESSEKLLENHLLTLPENANKTVFLYLNEEDVDEDNDGDVDENGDGIVDAVEITLHSLVIDNSNRESIYDHQVTMINLVDSNDFGLVKFYFVRSDETIETARFNRSVSFTQSGDLNLQNNTYQVFAIAQHNSSDIILANTELVLDETSGELFLIIEEDASQPSGYRMTVQNQQSL